MWNLHIVYQVLSGMFSNIGCLPFLGITKTKVSTLNKIPGVS